MSGCYRYDGATDRYPNDPPDLSLSSERELGFVMERASTLKLTRTLPALLTLGVTALASLAGSTSGFAASSYDGSWHVTVTADPGRCSDHFAVALRVSNGRVNYVGPFGSQAAGNVGANGAISVTISDVRASGALLARTGTGRWRSATCNGSWIAHRA